MSDLLDALWQVWVLGFMFGVGIGCGRLVMGWVLGQRKDRP